MIRNAPEHTILIVDDEDSLRKVLVKSLCDDNCRTISAVSGEEALAVIKKEKIDLIVTDLVMPGMDGIELVRQVRERALTPKVIVLTAFASEQSRQAAAELGVDCFLTKPFSLAYLKSKVDQLLISAATSETAAHASLFSQMRILESCGAVLARSRSAAGSFSCTKLIGSAGKASGVIVGYVSVLRMKLF